MNYFIFLLVLGYCSGFINSTIADETTPAPAISTPTPTNSTAAPTEAITTTPAEMTTATVPSQPDDSGSQFDTGSFIGGAVLAVGVTATIYFGNKFYRANNPDYRHI